ncbi:glucosamine-6-phosphate deaminase [Listeria booriae]|uniref:Glucosamine-6-phosphate deaminase n=1 Tax=Listeria booriae TaxID=1552123 RepID=A0A7X1D1P1_9LIST|nr:glucosamine-6-phosphate deaminase [Listeria booriae]MBC1332760.1 glucosamine-6-phosphate deaminase [Listeria booriae]MBC1973709.1 glucosamine-6-phosphate deaminase [Listeria booriae]MBC2031417.1 glucosamine-6-phosphate deaminase [Listeria booriae]MBC2147693.1 glucosamine-6-phosphate deaminase [Listeria booriae]MBC2240578.1 glucosamine-6-phosphate deaminase [Listeria booriae]
MKIIRTKTYDEMSQKAYELVKDVIASKENPVINTTTGASYDGMFEKLVEGINNDEVDIEKVFMMNLDEFIAPREQSFTVYNYMHQKFYDQIKKQPKEIALLDGSLASFDEEIARYNKILQANKRDLQILGLGVNAHLGANEPGTPFDARLFLADSDDSTINSTMLYYKVSREEAPEQMLTLGLADMMEAEQILVTASGTRKAEAVKATLEGPITVDCPASILQNHPNVVFIIDEEAGSLLTKY